MRTELKHVCRLVKGGLDPQRHADRTFAHYSIPAFDSGHGPVIELGGNIHSQKTPIPGDVVLVSKLNPRIPRVWHVNDDQRYQRICSTEFVALQPDPTALEPAYLSFALREALQAGFIKRNTAAATKSRERAKPSDFLRLRIPVPPLGEQLRIVGLLSRAENIVRMRREAEKKAKEIIPALFLDMFGDPGTNPKGWEVKRVGDIASYTRYGPRFPDRKYAETGAHILRTTDMDTSGNVRWEESPVLPVTQEEVSRFSLQPGTVVVTRTGATIGKIALFRGADRPCIAGAYLIELGTTDDVDPEYLLALLLSDYGQSALTSGSRAVAQPNLNAPTIRAIPLPIPPKAFQSSFAKRVSSFQALCRQQTGAIAVAEAAFQSLLAGMFFDGRAE